MIRIQKIFGRLLLLCIVFFLIPVQALAEDSVVASGTCGEMLTWTLDSNGSLVISGIGEMYDFTDTTQPWSMYKRDITYVNIENGVTCIGEYAFYACTNIQAVTIPNSMEIIADRAFSDCNMLADVIIPDHVTRIGRDAFAGCDSIVDIVIPASVEHIWAGAFIQCEGLKRVEFKDNVETLQRDIFADCCNLCEVVLPDGFSRISTGMFRDCDRLERIDIPDTVIIIDTSAFSYAGLTNISIPGNVDTVGMQAFFKCEKLVEAEIYNGVRVIESGAFKYCTSLTELTIPESIESIGSNAISDCSKLSQITFEGDAPSINGNFLTSVTATVYYPVNNTTWTEEVRQNYGGTLTWVPYGDSGDDEEISIIVNTFAGSVSAPEGGWKEGTNTFTVVAENACVVAVSYDGGATYTRLTASATGMDNTYSFTANDMTESSIVAVIMTGDANGDSSITNADVTRLKAAYQNKVQLDSLKWLAADVNNSGDITNADVTRLKAVYQNKTSFSW